jgi:TetR/AcrR family transcriptional regulator, ethionamide resistance regulator
MRAMSVATQRVKRRQQREETRRQILAAAQLLLREVSFRELSVDLLMSRTGHTRTVFYRHFDDIPSLVLALMTEIGSELVEVSEQWAQTERVGPEEARVRLARFVDFYVRYGPLVHAVAEAAHHDEAVEQAYKGMVEGFIELTTRAIQDRVDAGELALLDAPQIARALVRMLNSYLDDALGREGATDPERVLDAITTIWTRTLFPESAAASTGRFTGRGDPDADGRPTGR